MAGTKDLISFISVVVWETESCFLKICSLAVNTKLKGLSHFSSSNFVFCFLGKREILENPILGVCKCVWYVCDLGKEERKKKKKYIYIYMLELISRR